MINDVVHTYDFIGLLNFFHVCKVVVGSKTEKEKEVTMKISFLRIVSKMRSIMFCPHT